MDFNEKAIVLPSEGFQYSICSIYLASIYLKNILGPYWLE